MLVLHNKWNLLCLQNRILTSERIWFSPFIVTNLITVVGSTGSAKKIYKVKQNFEINTIFSYVKVVLVYITNKVYKMKDFYVLNTAIFIIKWTCIFTIIECCKPIYNI